MNDPGRRAVLEKVQRVREGLDPHRHAPDFGRHMLRIPVRDFEALKLLYPDINATDPQVRSAAWRQFELSPFADAYRVGALRRGVIKNGIILP